MFSAHGACMRNLGVLLVTARPHALPTPGTKKSNLGLAVRTLGTPVIHFSLAEYQEKGYHKGLLGNPEPSYPDRQHFLNRETFLKLFQVSAYSSIAGPWAVCEQTEKLPF